MESLRLWAAMLLMILTMPISSLAQQSDTSATVNESDTAWHDPFYTYRLRIGLDKPASGHIRLALSSQEIIDTLQQPAVDPLNIETLAFENAILVNPLTGQKVGQFFFAGDDSIDIDGQFGRIASGDSPWSGYDDRFMSLERVSDGERSFEALWISKDQILNQKLAQTVKLIPGKLYLLEYWVWMDPIDSTISIQLCNPLEGLFSELDCSYTTKLTRRAQWTRQAKLIRPDIENAELIVSHAFTGRCGVADLRLRPVELVLEADLPASIGALDLYCVARAGHRLPPADELDVVKQQPLTTAQVKQVTAERIDVNPDGVLLKGNVASLWTIPGNLPLRSRDLRAYKPAASHSVATVRLPRGTASTLLVAVDTGTPYAVFQNVTCELPIPIEIERLAEVPVYDGPSPRGKLLEHRLDARVPLNWNLSPPSTSGVHVVAITLTAPLDTMAGVYRDNLTFTVATQTPQLETFDLPIEIEVLPAALKPMKHFGTQFAGNHFLVRYDTAPYFTHPGASVADFHGMGRDDANPDMVVSLTSPDQDYGDLSDVRALASKYFHKMIDNHVLPQTPMLYDNFRYDIKEQGEGKAPKLENWLFEDYDASLDEFVLKREVPWFAVYHSNGHMMHFIRLSNGISYSFEPAPDDKTPWRTVSPAEYYRLVSDYFEAIAEHLHERGVLDRTLYIIDESDPSTYEVMRNYILALRERPHAKRIKFGHTSYKTSQYTRRTEDGQLLLADVLDVPMPDNDEHFNFFEPEWNARQDPPPTHQWVYYVETDHMVLEQAGLSTIVTPLKLKHFGADGWYCWASFIWDMPYPHEDRRGFKYPIGPTVNPWLNPFNHHGPGVMTFFYPPDPRGLPPEGTDVVIPSHRLSLMRDGIQNRALLEVLEKGEDDIGQQLTINSEALTRAKTTLDRLWAENPVQWYLSYGAYWEAEEAMHAALIRE